MLTRPVGIIVGGIAVLSGFLGSAEATQCRTINSIAYCKQVDSLGYSGFAKSGSYDDVVNMDKEKCECKYVKKTFSGPHGVLDEELSFHARGPLRLKQFAVYTKSKSANAKREHLRRHAHGHMHRRDIKTEVVTHSTTIYTTVDPPEPTPLAGGGVPIPKAHKEDPPTSSKPPKDTPKDNTPEESGRGGWERVSYYDSKSETAEGLVFLNHRGGDKSGDFDRCLGLSLSYANSAMTGGAVGPETLDDCMVPSGTEFLIFSDKKCKGDDCGYYRPGIPAYHGWGGSEKAFLMEFSMPRDKKGGLSGDIPALWLLNAKVPRTSQFGIKSGHCSCWPDCGEFDVFEALPGTDTEPAMDMIKTHFHCALGGLCGGHRDYFDRPLEETIKVAVLIIDSSAYVTKLHSKTNFDKVLSEKVLTECQTKNIFNLS